jgi:ribosomal protein L9
VDELAKNGHTISKSQIRLDAPIRSVGNYPVVIVMHPEVQASILMRVENDIGQEGEASPPAS